MISLKIKNQFKINIKTNGIFNYKKCKMKFDIKKNKEENGETKMVAVSEKVRAIDPCIDHGR